MNNERGLMRILERIAKALEGSELRDEVDQLVSTVLEQGQWLEVFDARLLELEAVALKEPQE